MNDTAHRSNEHPAGTESANFVEQWVRKNKAIEILFDGQPWHDESGRYIKMVDFGETIELDMGWMEPADIPTFMAHTPSGHLRIVQFYVKRDRVGRYKCHVRVREERNGVPAFLILDH